MGTPLDRTRPSVAEEPLNDREREVARLRGVLTTRTHAGPWLLEIAGEPGIGKTRLLTEWRALAERAGLTVLAGRVPAADRERPYGLFRAPVARALELPGVAAALDPADLALLTGLAADEPDGERAESTADPGRPQLRRCIADLLWTAADAGRRLTLCLDDLHWADDASVHLLAHLLHRPRPRVPLILVCSLRPRQRPAALTAGLAEPDDAYRVERLRPGPLPHTPAAGPPGPGTDAERRRSRHEAADGNPFYLRVLARSPGPLRPPGGVTPWLLSDEAVAVAGAALARELAPLDDVERAVLRAAAVLGEDFDPAHLTELAAPAATTGPAGPGEPPQPATGERESTALALDRLIGLDLVRVDHTEGRRCRLRHPVLRAVVYREAPHGWRRAAHARAARVLREAGADPARCAPHLARGAEPGDLAAIQLLAAAAEQVRDTEPGAAAAWLGTALGLVREDGTGLRPQLTAALARALGAAGRLRECRDLLRRIARPPGAPRTRADTELVLFHAMIERHLGEYGRAEALLTAELALTAGPEVGTAGTGAGAGAGAGAVETTRADTTSAARAGTASATGPAGPLRLELCTVALLRNAHHRARPLAEELLRHAVDVRDRRLRTAATVRLAHCGALAGDVPALLRRAGEAGALVDSTGDAELVPLLDTLAQLGWSEALAERHQDALRHTARGIRLARTAGQLVVLPHLRLAHAYAAVGVGRLTDALRSAGDAERDARRMDRPALLGFALALQAWATILRDGPDAAAPTAERAVRELGGAGGRFWTATAGILAEVRLEQGRPGEGLELIRSAVGHARHHGGARPASSIWYAHAARAAAALGDRDQAGGWADRASCDVLLPGLPGQRGYAALARSYAVPDPVGALGEAVAAFRAGGLVPMECRARLLLAAELTTRGPREQAAGLEQANRAKALAEGSGARRLHREAVDLQRRLGARRPRPARAAGTAPAALSEREREIARMVALGLSNNDIGRALAVSPKTVEAHLTRIFRRAGVRSRIALAAALSPAGAPGNQPAGSR
ncbi:AAA family ATPase [Kitasatospora sp. NPDC059160]|uniref:helix-turn-helix transcriptional regulator n=1 Tax=Kitasatospora sp. NPDC059160 TaxID=3346748 RepID=UPI0036A75C31